jgi:hypothetical protein
VVTCYTALRRQLAQQAASYGIKHLVWSDRNSPGSPDPASVRLVIMITDDLSTSDALQLVSSTPFFVQQTLTWLQFDQKQSSCTDRRG